MTDYLIGLGTGLLLASIPIVILWRLLRQEWRRSALNRWWIRHQQNLRREGP